MQSDLGYRRIQGTERGSYLISLPKEWVTSLELTKGKQIAFKVQKDLSLTLIPRKILEEGNETEQHDLREYEVVVDDGDNPESTCRRITSLYVNSADIIHIRFKQDKLLKEYKSEIRHLTKNVLLGSEIINEKPGKITLQILVSHPDFPVDSAIRRMAILALSANRDAVSALEDWEVNMAQTISDICYDVERLNLYVIRQLKYGLERNLFEELGFETPKEFLGYRIVTNDIKSISDNALNITQNIEALQNMIDEGTLYLSKPVDEELYSQILDFNLNAHTFIEDSLNALFKRDYNKADTLLSEAKKFALSEVNLLRLMSSKKLDPNVTSVFRLILDGSRRIIEHGKNISEVTLNRTIEKTNPPFN